MFDVVEILRFFAVQMFKVYALGMLSCCRSEEELV